MNCGCPHFCVFFFGFLCVFYTKRWKLGDRGRGKADSGGGESANRKSESGGLKGGQLATSKVGELA